MENQTTENETDEYEWLTEEDLEDRFNEFLDDINGEVTICGYQYDASRALKELDPIAYRQELLGWISILLEDEILIENDEEEYRWA